MLVSAPLPLGRQGNEDLALDRSAAGLTVTVTRPPLVPLGAKDSVPPRDPRSGANISRFRLQLAVVGRPFRVAEGDRGPPRFDGDVWMVGASLGCTVQDVGDAHQVLPGGWPRELLLQPGKADRHGTRDNSNILRMLLV